MSYWDWSWSPRPLGGSGGWGGGTRGWAALPLVSPGSLTLNSNLDPGGLADWNWIEKSSPWDTGLVNAGRSICGGGDGGDGSVLTSLPVPVTLLCCVPVVVMHSIKHLSVWKRPCGLDFTCERLCNIITSVSLWNTKYWCLLFVLIVWSPK